MFVSNDLGAIEILLLLLLKQDEQWCTPVFNNNNEIRYLYSVIYNRTVFSALNIQAGKYLEH